LLSKWVNLCRYSEDWKPVLSISSCIYGLQFLFMDPNPDDPLNKDAVGLAPFTASFCSQNTT
jgi:ubiquitin-protein ligase